MPTLNFYSVDPITFEDSIIGTVSVEGKQMTSSNPDLLDLVESVAGLTDGVLSTFSDWSNGYMRSELGSDQQDAVPVKHAQRKKEPNG